MKRILMGLVIAVVTASGQGAVAATAATFTASTTTGAVGTVVTVHSINPCAAPVGATAWNALIAVAQATNPQLSFTNLPVATDGSWTGQITIPTGTLPGPAQLTATCFDAAHTTQDTVTYTPLDFTVQSGTLDHLILSPATATITAGAAQAYTAEGFDAQGNDLGDVTAATIFSVNGAGKCAASSCSAAPGAHTVTGTDGTATGTAGLTVTKAVSATTLSFSPGNPRFGTPVKFLATVRSTTPNPVRPSGTISFLLDGRSKPVATLALAGGSATFTTSGLGTGSHTVVAVYSGDSNFLLSTSSAAAVTVSTATTATGTHLGGLVVATGSSVLLVDSTVTGPIVVRPGGSLDIENSTITGTVSVVGASALRICGSTIRGNLAVTGGRGFELIGDSGDDKCAANRVGGSLVLWNNTHGLEVIGNYVRGCIISAANSGAGAFPEDTAPEISGNGRR